MKRIVLFSLLAFVVVAFLFTRLYAIDKGLFFFNDYGRDLFVLHQWKESLKPPLLGPQNSALPFNQPALYFYWLMPVYVLSGFSAFSNVYTLVLTALGGLALGMFLLRKQPSWWPIVLAYSWLIVIHPQHIIQNRFVWNPSFIPVFLGFSLLSFVHLRRQWSWKTLWVFAISMSMAVSFSYAIAPVFMVLGLLLVFWWYPHWKKILQLWGALAASLLLFQLPTLAFEVKYRFQLTRAVLFGDRPTQVGIDVSSKLRSLGELILGGEQPWQVVLAVFLLFLLAGNLWFIRKRRDQGKQSPLTYTVFLTAFPLLLGTFLLTLILPIAVHSHYIFGFTTLLFLLLASLESRLRVIGLAIFSVFWLQPFFTASMFEPARRTVHDLESCAELVCAEETQPLFVATESRHHTFHNGPEFRYAFAHAGCIVNALEQDPSSAQYLAVVEDDGEYQHGKSDFYELSLFGKSEVIRTYQCSAKMQVFILERIE